MLKLLSRLFRHRDAATKVVPLAVRGKYDAAQTTEDNRRHWAMADSLSAAAANSRSVRRTLRNRARYEVANNSYAKGIISTLANDVVGRGPILQVATGDDTANKGTRQLWLYAERNLPEPKRDEFNALKKADLKTAKAWALKENFRIFWTHHNTHGARQFFNKWFA